MSAPLAFDAVTCTRAGRDLFAGLSFVLAAGEALVVTGPNGAGKSSLIGLAAGLLAPSAGTVWRGGAVALLGESAALDREATLAQALGFWATLDDCDSAPGRVAKALRAVALDPLADVPVRLLSTGQRRRAGFARVIAAQARLWLLDEPANGLDEAALARLGAAIARHRADGGAALIATHLPLPIADAGTIVLGEA